MPDKWPGTLYDYARGEIVDEQAADVDVEGGLWVRCRCCDVQRRMRSPFMTGPWELHKKAASHVARMKASEKTKDVRDSPEYADFAAAMMESIEKDTDYLVFYRKQLEQRAKEEVQTKELIQKMALLVTEQQDDVESLRDEVSELRHVVQELREEMKAMADVNAKLRRVGGSGEKYAQREPSRFIEIIESDDDATPTKRRWGATCRKTQDREIDMFDEDLQLMQLD